MPCQWHSVLKENDPQPGVMHRVGYDPSCLCHRVALCSCTLLLHCFWVPTLSCLVTIVHRSYRIWPWLLNRRRSATGARLPP